MFKWAARRFKKAIEEIEREERGDQGIVAKSSNVVSLDHDELGNSVRFDLSSAVGGRILRVRRYDRKTHEEDTQIYVIPQGEDVGERVSKILNLELIK